MAIFLKDNLAIINIDGFMNWCKYKKYAWFQIFAAGKNVKLYEKTVLFLIKTKRKDKKDGKTNF